MYAIIIRFRRGWKRNKNYFFFRRHIKWNTSTRNWSRIRRHCPLVKFLKKKKNNIYLFQIVPVFHNIGVPTFIVCWPPFSTCLLISSLRGIRTNNRIKEKNENINTHFFDISKTRWNECSTLETTIVRYKIHAENKSVSETNLGGVTIIWSETRR